MDLGEKDMSPGRDMRMIAACNKWVGVDNAIALWQAHDAQSEKN